MKLKYIHMWHWYTHRFYGRCQFVGIINKNSHRYYEFKFKDEKTILIGTSEVHSEIIP